MALPREVGWLCARLALSMNYSTGGPEVWAEYLQANLTEDRRAKLLDALNDIASGRYDMREIEAVMQDNFEGLGIDFKGDMFDLFRQVKVALGLK